MQRESSGHDAASSHKGVLDMISTSCPNCRTRVEIPLWRLIPSRNTPASMTCRRCHHSVGLPDWWHCLTIFCVCMLAIVLYMLSGSTSVAAGLLMFVVTYAVLMIIVNALFLLLGGRLVMRR